MKSIKLSTVVLLLGLLCGSMALGQQQKNVVAKQELASYMESMGMNRAGVEAGSNFFLHCKVRMVPRDSVHFPSQESEFRYWVSEEGLRYEDERMRVYQDDQMIATVIPHARSLYLSESPNDGQLESKLGFRLALKDSLWDHIQVISVKNVCLAEGRNGREFRIAVAPRAQQMAGVEEATFVVDVEREQFVSVLAKHPSGHQLARSEYRYLTLDWEYEQAALDRPVKKMVFASRKQLNQDFDGYQLIELDKQ